MLEFLSLFFIFILHALLLAESQAIYESKSVVGMKKKQSTVRRRLHGRISSISMGSQF